MHPVQDRTVYEMDPPETLLWDHRGRPIPRVTDTKLGYIGFREHKERP